MKIDAVKWEATEHLALMASSEWTAWMWHANIFGLQLGGKGATDQVERTQLANANSA